MKRFIREIIIWKRGKPKIKNSYEMGNLYMACFESTWTWS